MEEIYYSDVDSFDEAVSGKFGLLKAINVGDDYISGIINTLGLQPGSLYGVMYNAGSETIPAERAVATVDVYFI